MLTKQSLNSELEKEIRFYTHLRDEGEPVRVYSNLFPKMVYSFPHLVGKPAFGRGEGTYWEVGYIFDYNHYFDWLKSNYHSDKTVTVYDSDMVFSLSSKYSINEDVINRICTYLQNDTLFDDYQKEFNLARIASDAVTKGVNLFTGKNLPEELFPTKREINIKILENNNKEELARELQYWIRDNVNFDKGDQVDYQYSVGDTYRSVLITHVTSGGRKEENLKEELMKGTSTTAFSSFTDDY